MLSGWLLALASASLLSSPHGCIAIPSPGPVAAGQPGLTIPLTRRAPPVRTVDDWAAWAQNERQFLALRYGSDSPQKRSEGVNLLTNQNADSSFFGSLAIGTPPVAFDVVLDTGSADLWVADTSCTSGCSKIALLEAASSSTLKNLSQPFQIQYGSGQAAGYLVQDVVQMAGFSVSNQVFAAVDQISSGLLTSPVSGLLGLAWQTIAASGATPFWQTLASSSGTWTDPVMSFQLTRFLNATNVKDDEPGGTFTMGFVNSSLYTGTIDYQNIPVTPSYWLLTMSSMTVQGKSITIPTGSAAYAAIDTGTTLVGGPSSAIQNIFAQIPGSAPGTGSWEGYYTYPCNTAVNVAISFGGPSWSVSPADFQLVQLSSSQCVGAFFVLSATSGGTGPSWVVGDTFLKNVYSVFRYSPASVGFAQLSETALAMNGVDGNAPSATIGSVSASATAGAGGFNGAGILCDFTDEPLEGELADEELRRLLVATDLTEGDCTGAETMRLLHTTCGLSSHWRVMWTVFLAPADLAASCLRGALPVCVSDGRCASLQSTHHR
ncbi:hypothetical protein SCLCIDRAFT_139594 [Scleroderma citrinum Foug A]|uniref:Peptidase A1 domain-containing protein n=1 Tax=Scleroderma citrinum Foug A TaxID=1036808 RepID=A0A0C3DAM3_9AGAM|nr:hypothetical protein SCLCIDRAFT_139594 [Scleroderma citrinum Foug A]